MLYIALIPLAIFIGLQVLAANVASCVIKESEHPIYETSPHAKETKSSAIN